MPKDSPRNTVWIIPDRALDRCIKACLGSDWTAKTTYYAASPMKSSCGANAQFIKVIPRKPIGPRLKPPSNRRSG